MRLLIVLALAIACASAQNYPPLTDSVLQMLSEGQTYMNAEPPDTKILLREYDFIVVGAGSAGSVIASRLSEVPEWKVLLIEAGQEENIVMDIPLAANMLQFTGINWKYKTVPSNKYCLGMTNNQCNFPRGKVMGGSSVLNYMIFTRGNYRDFNHWEELGNPGWSWENVLPYFKKLEDMTIEGPRSDTRMHGRNGPMTISEAPFETIISKAFVTGGTELGYSRVNVNSERQTGFSRLPVTLRNGTRCSTSRGYLHPARNRRNLHVRKYSQVTRVIIDPKTKTAIGVEFERARKRYQVLARKEVILSAGAIGSPHLLLLSGVGPKKHLQEKGVKVVKNLPVGYNLQDHVALGGLTVLINQPVSIKTDRILSNATALNMFLTQHRGPITIPGGCEALAFIDTKNDDPRNTDGYPDLELLLVAGAVSSEPTLKLNFGIKNSVYDSVYRDTEALDGFMVLPMIMRPKSTGFVLLKDRNPFHSPYIIPNYFADEEDLDVAVAGVRKVQELIKTPAMRQLGAQLLQTPLPGCTSMPFDSDDYWKCHARHLPFTIYHLSGSCKMGPASDRTAVVDPRLRVHGVRNLRVVDASIMPKVTASHTNAPVIMIAEKAADMIKQDHGKRTDF
nr:PREDICTED: glucose dehydrogenase [FAD, quinone]-like [Bemisia tabaci]